MILGDPKRWDEYAADGVYGERRLDELLRAAAKADPDADAIIVPDEHAARTTITWAALDRQADALANHFLDAGLKPDDVVLVVMGSSAAALAVLFALSRSGLIGILLSPALGTTTIGEMAVRSGAKAIACDVTTGSRPTADIVQMAAMNALDVRFIYGFGGSAPDGLIPGDDILAATGPEPNPGVRRGGRSADHVFAVTIDGDGPDAHLIARNHGQFTAAALPVVERAKLSGRSVLACAHAPCSLAAISGAIIPWLLARCRLALVPSWELAKLAQHAAITGATHVVVPGGHASDGNLSGRTIMRVWRDVAAPGDSDESDAIHLVSLGECALNVSTGSGQANIMALSGLAFAGSSTPVAEPRVQGIVHRGDSVDRGDLLRGPLAVRGPATPVLACPHDDASAQRFAANGFMVTRLRAELLEDTGPAIRVIGSMRESVLTGPFSITLAEADKLYGGLAGVSDAAAYAVDHPVLGQALGIAYTGASETTLERFHDELDALGAGLAVKPVEVTRVDAIPRDATGRVQRGALLIDRAAG